MGPTDKYMAFVQLEKGEGMVFMELKPQGYCMNVFETFGFHAALSVIIF